MLAVESLLCEEIVACPFCPEHSADGPGNGPVDVAIAGDAGGVGNDGPTARDSKPCSDPRDTSEATPGTHRGSVGAPQHGNGNGDAASARTGGATRRLVLDGGYDEPSPENYDPIDALICPPPPRFSVGHDAAAAPLQPDCRAVRCACEGGHSFGGATCQAGSLDGTNGLLRSLHSDRARRSSAGHAVASSPRDEPFVAEAQTSPQRPAGPAADAAPDMTAPTSSWTGAFENWVEHARTSHGIWVASPRRAGNIRFSTTVSDDHQGIRFESSV